MNQQPHLLKMWRDDTGATVRGKEFHTELLLHRNEELRKVRIPFLLHQIFVTAALKGSVLIFSSKWTQEPVLEGLRGRYGFGRTTFSRLGTALVDCS